MTRSNNNTLEETNMILFVIIENLVIYYLKLSKHFKNIPSREKQKIK